MLYTVEHQREISVVAGPYSVTIFRHPGDREDRASARIMDCITGIATAEECDERALHRSHVFNAVIKTPMLSVKFALVVAEAAAPRVKVAALVRDREESCTPELVVYYPSIEALAMKARSSAHWERGTTMVWAASANKYLILNQTAPDSCEFMVLTPHGFADVLTCHRYDQDELTQQLLVFVERMEEDAAQH